MMLSLIEILRRSRIFEDNNNLSIQINVRKNI